MANADVYTGSDPHPTAAAARPLWAGVPGHIAAFWRALSATDLRLALTIGFGALVLRVVWVLAVHRHGFVINDALFYDIFGQQIAHGNGFTQLDGAASAAWPPVYPLVLAGAFSLFGTNPIVG